MGERFGTGTQDMSRVWQLLYTDPQLYRGITDLLYVLSHVQLKATPESVVESMGSVLGLINQEHAKLNKECLLCWNGMSLSEREPFVAGAMQRLPSGFKMFQHVGRHVW